VFNQIRQGFDTLGKDISFGAGLVAGQGKLNQQANALLPKKKAVAAKMPVQTPAQKPSFIQNMQNNYMRNYTSTGKYPSYLQ
jgi:hypothetical protein